MRPTQEGCAQEGLNLEKDSLTCFSPAKSPNSKKRRLPKPLRLNFTHMSNMRVIQRKLVYIINLPPSVADESTLLRYEYFGQYGTITKCCVNKHNAFAGYGAYITYSTEEEAAKCIKACQGFKLDGNVLTTTYGTTKYCSYFLRGMNCPKVDCLYLHKMAPPCDNLNREQVSKTKQIEPEGALVYALNIQVVNSSDTKLPAAFIARERAQSEAVPFMPRTRPRIYSRDVPSRSRFEFVEVCEENYEDLPPYFEEVLQSTSASSPTAEISSDALQEILSPDNPDIWATDIFEAFPFRKSFDETSSTFKNDSYLVAPKFTSTIELT